MSQACEHVDNPYQESDAWHNFKGMRLSFLWETTNAERMPIYVFAQTKFKMRALRNGNQDQIPLLSTIGLNDKSLNRIFKHFN